MQYRILILQSHHRISVEEISDRTITGHYGHVGLKSNFVSVRNLAMLFAHVYRSIADRHWGVTLEAASLSGAVQSGSGVR